MIAATDSNKARHARIERIAMILDGQPVGSVQTADVYFNERTAKRAEAIARRDWLNAEKSVREGTEG